MKLKQISGLGTAAQYDVGTSANNIVVLDSNGKLPAIDGSQLINVSAGGGGSESSSNIPKYTVTNISSNTITSYTSSSSPLDLSTLKTVATMDLFYVDFTTASAYCYTQLPAANSLQEGEYIVVARKGYYSNRSYRLYVNPKSGDTLYSTTSNSNTYYILNTGSAMLVSNGTDAWYLSGWGAS